MMMGLVLAIGVVVGASGADRPLTPVKTWTDAEAGHLLRRAGFGGTPEQIAHLTKLGRDKAVDYLLNYENAGDEPLAVDIGPIPKPLRQTHPDADREELQRLRQQQQRQDRLKTQQALQWWVQTMATTRRPFQEKMVLFWHGHFTSGYREVRSAHAMLRQNELFRARAVGSFRDLLIEITEDPAMILYLNTQQNVNRKPNENYARELMELFTMGVGNYTEQDIKEAARAFTGIKINPVTGQVVYVARQHDFGRKTFLGRTGAFDPADIIDIILAQPVTAEYMARKLWTFFAYEDPEPAVMKGLAATLRKYKYEFKPMLRQMFRSQAFYGERARFTHIKSPTELVVGTIRALDIDPTDTTALVTAISRMGQELFQPPNVKGWDGGAAWITTSTLYNRYNLLAAAIYGTDTRQARQQRQWVRRMLDANAGESEMKSTDVLARPQPAYDPLPELEEHGLTTAAAVVDHYVGRLLQREIEPDRRRTLIQALDDKVDFGKATTRQKAQAVRALLHLIVSMPEYQLS